MKEVKNNSFVWYATFTDAIEQLEEAYPELAIELMKAIINYGTYGEYDRTNPIINMAMANIGFGIDKAKERYTTAVENGKKGGRPKINLNQEEVEQRKKELGTWKAVASSYGISEETLRIKRNEWKNPKNPKNLNDNVKDKDKDKENIKDKEMITEDRKKELKETIGADGNYKDTFIDNGRFDFYDLPQFTQISLITEAFPEFTAEEAKYILTDIIN